MCYTNHALCPSSLFFVYVDMYLNRPVCFYKSMSLPHTHTHKLFWLVKIALSTIKLPPVQIHFSHLQILSLLTQMRFSNSVHFLYFCNLSSKELHSKVNNTMISLYHISPSLFSLDLVSSKRHHCCKVSESWTSFIYSASENYPRCVWTKMENYFLLCSLHKLSFS